MHARCQIGSITLKNNPVTVASGLDQLATMLTGDVQQQQKLKSGRDYFAFLTSGCFYGCCRRFVLEIATNTVCYGQYC